MIFQKPRKLPHGKELLRTEKFTLIYLGSGNLHYSFIGEKGLVYGDIDLKRNHFKIIPLITLATLITSYLVFGTNPTSAMIEPNPDVLQEEIAENDERDKRAKHADENYLKQTEEQKLAVIKSSDSSKKSKNISYHVKDTDTLQSISSHFNVTPEAIREASNLKPTDKIYPGDVLSIPNRRGLLYKFKNGDTLAKVASTYRVSVEEIIEENKLEDSDIFMPGQKIFLPGAIIPDPTPVWYSPVASNIITSGFGWRTFPRYQFHDALDLKSNYEPVRAARTGKVIYSGWMGGYGNVVILEHTGDLKTLYAHNSKLYVREGEFVLGGKIISRSGCTGYCFG
ncbi:MAG TPA: LysM peptidoglycan-binding domain-containing protein, partial [Leptospiraceae bacterium]|nr:LysM peptidoglycan-binding domain-containing protein [Leptospiraceae bacterium]